MKLVQLLLLGSVWTVQSHAQENKEPALTLEQKWQIEKTEAFLKSNNNGPAAASFLKNFKKVVAANILCGSNLALKPTLQLQGDRVSMQTALLTWDVTNETVGDNYIVERRYNSPVGEYDSVTTLKGGSADAVLRSYQYVDDNNFNGKTWYRVRLSGIDEVKKLVCVEGYNNTVSVYPNPSTSSSVVVQLHQFKTDNNTSLVVLDARGGVVYTQQKAFANDAQVLRLQNLKLLPGTYYIRVANKLNSGGTSFIVH